LNRIFKVDDIVDKNGNPYNSSPIIEKPIFIIRDTSSKQIIYYKYDYDYESNFPFLTPVDVLNETKLCPKIEKNIDEFTGLVKFNSPLRNGHSIANVIFYKEINKTRTVYYLSLHTKGSTVVVDGTGATILFSDGTKLTKQIKIDVKPEESGFDYSTFISLTLNDLNVLTEKKIKAFRLYIFDEDVSLVDAYRFKVYANCIKKAK
jgi:hypothetical protein